MMKQLVAVLISVLLSLGGAFALADAELYYNWDGEFPETPQLEYHAYAVQPNQPDGDALAGAVWPELEWTQTSDANGSLYVLEPRTTACVVAGNSCKLSQVTSDTHGA